MQNSDRSIFCILDIYMQNMYNNMQNNMQNMQKICMKYAEYDRKYARNMQNMTENMPNNMQNMQKICQKICNPVFNMQNSDRSIFCIFCIYIHSPLC